MNRSTPDLPVHHQLLEFTQIHIHRVRDAIQPSHPLLSPSSPAPNPSQWNLKKNYTNELIYKIGTDLENKELIITRGEGWGRGMDREFGTDKKIIVNYYIVHL